MTISAINGTMPSTASAPVITPKTKTVAFKGTEKGNDSTNTAALVAALASLATLAVSGVMLFKAHKLTKEVKPVIDSANEALTKEVKPFIAKANEALTSTEKIRKALKTFLEQTGISKISDPVLDLFAKTPEKSNVIIEKLAQKADEMTKITAEINEKMRIKDEASINKLKEAMGVCRKEVINILTEGLPEGLDPKAPIFRIIKMF